MVSMQFDEGEKLEGLTSAQVAERVAAGKVNAAADVRTRSIPRILRDNLCTLFNFVNIVLAAAVFWTGSYQNLMFMVIIVANLVIGIFQEVRAKLMVDRMSVLTSTRAHAVRDGEQSDIPIDQIVLDDVIVLGRGDQVPSDCKVIEGACSANESLITGESDPIPKRLGDELMSGSFVAAGSCTARVTAVGADNYANKLNNDVRDFKRIGGEIMASLDSIVKYVSIVLVPLGALLFGKELVFSPHGDLTSAILHTSAALIGMIPQGLILLTSAVLAISVFRLAQHRVLVQQMHCVETLARVDVVCLDKTGTITTGEMDVDEVIPIEGSSYDEALHALKALVAIQDKFLNETSRALREYVGALSEPLDSPELVRGAARVIPFSSERKYSGVCYGSEAGNYAIGAAEFVLRGNRRLGEVRHTIERLAGLRRVLVLAEVQDFDEHDAIVGQARPLALVFVKDRIRSSARDTLEFFHDQGVRVNVISGDAAATVSRVAKAAGVYGADRSIDMSSVESEEELERAARDCRVFGRVTPKQKERLVSALQNQGHTVAMVGDGVNDVLALHASNCSVAMGSGTDAARSIAQVVLLDDDFASLPDVVAEGRRSINNLQRSAVLYLTKTIYSAALAVLFVPLTFYDFPFSPVQLTVVSFFTIGLPSFVLALEPNRNRVRGKFLRNVATRSAPGAVAVFVAILAAVAISVGLGLTQGEFQTICVIAAAVICMNVVVRQSQPLNLINSILVSACIVGLFVSFTAASSFLMLTSLSGQLVAVVVGISVVVSVAFNLVYGRIIRRQKAYLDKLEAAQALEREL